jgi:hypothetical protein
MAGLSAVLGIGAQAAGQESARETTVAGAESRAKIDEMGREAAQREFQRQIERQQPYLDAGVSSLPEFIRAIENKADVSELPATRIQSSLISEFLGSESPEYIKDKAIVNLNAVEAEKNKGRLADLINIGLGGTASAAGSRVDLGSTASNISNIGNITAQGLSDAAKMRQDTVSGITGGLSGLPAYIAAQKGGNTGIVNPNITQQNPLGLTPGQGL